NRSQDRKSEKRSSSCWNKHAIVEHGRMAVPRARSRPRPEGPGADCGADGRAGADRRLRYAEQDALNSLFIKRGAAAGTWLCVIARSNERIRRHACRRHRWQPRSVTTGIPARLGRLRAQGHCLSVAAVVVASCADVLTEPLV